jgi:multisubunit Na+/H+ antiporter MnhB subunit
MTTHKTEKEMLPEAEKPDSLHTSEAEVENAGLQFEAAPDGGLQAWLVVTGAAFVFFCGLGYNNSFGVFQEYFISHQLQHKSPDDISWIGSLSSFLQLGAGLVGGPLFDRYGAMVCVTPFLRAGL